MKCNQWPLKYVLQYFFPGDEGPGGSLQGACIYSSCFWGLGSSLAPGEVTGNLPCANIKKRQKKQRKEREHKRGQTPYKTNCTGLLWRTTLFSLVGCFQVGAPRKEFGWGRVVPFNVCQAFHNAVSSHPASSPMKGRFVQYLTMYQAPCIELLCRPGCRSYHPHFTDEDD